MITFHELSAYPEAELFIPLVLPWLHEAGAAFFDRIFGSRDLARRTLASWMTRPSSELSISRATLLLERNRPAGAFVALGGADLARCRKADVMAVLSTTRGDERQRLLARMLAMRGLFPAVQADEFYLSKVGVAPDRRAHGLGRALVAEYFVAGRAAGYRRFRLDVSAENHTAIALYRSMGFQVERAASSADARQAYLAMVRRQDDIGHSHADDHRSDRISV